MTAPATNGIVKLIFFSSSRRRHTRWPRHWSSDVCSSDLAAVQGAMDAKLRNMGEACTAANRILVHEGIADEFQAKFAEAMRARKTGRGTEAGVNVGPIIDDKARDDVHGLVTEAVDAGATVVTGGQTIDGEGYFYEPTIL